MWEESVDELFVSLPLVWALVLDIVSALCDLSCKGSPVHGTLTRGEMAVPRYPSPDSSDRRQDCHMSPCLGVSVWMREVARKVLEQLRQCEGNPTASLKVH